jgi:hypothetical protein
MSKTAETIASHAAMLVTGERAETYGHPLDDFARTGLMWGAILGTQVTAEQVALMMVALKISRECHTAHPTNDNVIDAVGYLLAHALVVEERAARAKK